MSITFWTNGDSTVVTTYDCHQCDGRAYEEYMELGFHNGEQYEYDPDIHANSACRECKGKGVIEFEDDEHSINLANSNAASWLKLVGVPFDYCGTIERPVLLEWDDIREAMLEIDEGGYARHAFMSGHESFMYFRRLTERWNELVAVAQANSYEIHWG